MPYMINTRCIFNTIHLILRIYVLYIMHFGASIMLRRTKKMTNVYIVDLIARSPDCRRNQCVSASVLSVNV